MNEGTYSWYLHNFSIRRWGLDSVPVEYRDYQMCFAAVTNSGCNIEYVPEEYKDYPLCLAAVSTHWFALEYVPAKLQDYKICMAAVQYYGWAFQIIPEEYKDIRMYLIAKQTYKYNLESPFTMDEIKEYQYSSITKAMTDVFSEVSVYYPLGILNMIILLIG